MSKKSIKFLLVFAVIFSMISSICLATDEEGVLLSTLETDSIGEANYINEDLLDESAYTQDEITTDNSDKYLINPSEDVVIEATEAINGNCFVVAKTVTVNGQIGGDLFVLTENLNIDGGQIYGNVFAIATSITHNGMIYDLYAISNDVTVLYDGITYRDLKVVCNNFSINGAVGKDVYVMGNISLEDDAEILGNLTYVSDNEIEVPEGCVSGEVNYNHKVSTTVNTTPSIVNILLGILTFLITVLVVWFLMGIIAPKFANKLNNISINSILFGMLKGLAFVVITPIVVVILLLTKVLSLVGLLLGATYFLVLALAPIILLITVGNMLGSKVKELSMYDNIFAILILALAYELLTLIPVLGTLVTIAVYLAGTGIFLQSIYAKLNKKDDKKEVAKLVIEPKKIEAKEEKKIEVKKEVKPIKKETPKKEVKVTKKTNNTKSSKTSKKSNTKKTK